MTTVARKFVIALSGIGLIVYVILHLLGNLALVPSLGARGAAITMLVSQAFAQLLLNACFAETRPLFRMQCRAFLPVPPR